MTSVVWERTRSLLPARADWAASRRNPRRDLVAGLTVAIVALPLALGFGVTSGMGAASGIATAVVAGAVAAVFGGSNLQVSGPTGAMTVVLVPVVHEHGTGGVLMVGLLAGVALIAMAYLRLGRLVRFLPMPVIEGFTAGIAVVIALQQVPSALGVTGSDADHVWAVAADAVVDFARDPHLTAPALAVAVAALMLLGGRRWPTIPFSLVGVALATVAAELWSLPVARIGELPAGLPAPSLSFVDLGAIGALLPAALAVCALAALESLLSATVADGMTVDQHHDPDRELFGQGLANLAAPVFGGMPATAAIARTAVNVRSGARSKLAALTHAVVLLLIVSTLAPLVSEIPLAALAGVLLATTVRMVEVTSLLALARATRADGLVLLVTFGVTVALDLIMAVSLGVGVAVVLALRSVAQSVRVEEVPLDADHPADHTAEERALLAEHIVAYRIDGPLFFAAAERFLVELAEVGDVRVVILRMSRVTTLDATGAGVLDEAIRRLEHRGIDVLLSGIDPRHDEVLQRLGVADHLRVDGRVLADTPAAIRRARELLHPMQASGPETGKVGVERE